LTGQQEESLTESALSDLIRKFLEGFKHEGNYAYLEKIDGLLSKTFITINPQDLLNFEFEEGLNLYNYLIEKPKSFIKNTKKAITEIYYNKYNHKKEFDIIIYEVERKISITEDLGNSNINEIVTLTGLVTSKTSIFNIADERSYVCPDGHKSKSNFKPRKCQDNDCNFKSQSLEEITTKENFSRHRNLYLKSEDEESLNQEDELRLDAKNILCEMANIGDRIKVTGIIETEDRGNSKNYQNVLRCLGIEKLDDIDLSITKDDVKEFIEYPNQDDFYTRLIHSISPSIYGWLNVKESILLQLVGSPLH